MTSLPITGLAVPEFSAPATSGVTFTLSAQRGKSLVLYFYPKDDTPGCTVEGQTFTAFHGEFTKANTAIFGVSRDSLRSHEGFKAKMAFTFELIADPDETVCNLFDVMKMKNMYGKQVRGIERSTFLIDTNGRVVREWRAVKVTGHVEEVLEAAKAL